MFWRAATEKAIVRKKSREHLLLFLPSSGTPTSRLAPPQQDWRRPRRQPPQQPSLRRRLSKKTHYRERKEKKRTPSQIEISIARCKRSLTSKPASLSLSHAAKIYFRDRSLQSWNENLWTSKFARRIVAKHMQTKKGVQEGKERRLFCFACVQFFCVDFFVCVGYYVRLLCEDLTARRKTGNQKQKIEQLESGLCFLILMNFFLSFFLSSFLPSFSVLACVSPNSRTLSWPKNQKTNKKYVPLSTRRSSFCTRVRSLQ